MTTRGDFPIEELLFRVQSQGLQIMDGHPDLAVLKLYAAFPLNRNTYRQTMIINDPYK